MNTNFALKLKSFLFSIILVVSFFSFISCGNLFNASSEPTEEEKLLNQKKEAYNFWLGTWILSEESKIFKIGDEITFNNDSIEFKGKTYKINLNTDLFFHDELSEELSKMCNADLTIINENIYISLYKFCYGGSNICLKNDFVTMVEKKSSTNNSEENNSTETSSKLEGTYSFSNATGSQVNGSITLNSNGTWSYSGSKTTLTPGTYSVSNNELTLNWTSKTGNYTLNRTDTFTVSVSGSEATLTSQGSGISAFFSDFFGITSTMTLTLSYSSN